MKREFREIGRRRHNGVAQQEWDRVGAARRDADREKLEAKEAEVDPFDFMTEEFWEARRAFVRRATDDQLAVALGYARSIETRGHAPEGSPSRCLLEILELENTGREAARFNASMAEHEKAKAAAEAWHVVHPEWALAHPAPPVEVEGAWMAWRSSWYLVAMDRG